MQTATRNPLRYRHLLTRLPLHMEAVRDAIKGRRDAKTDAEFFQARTAYWKARESLRWCINELKAAR